LLLINFFSYILVLFAYIFSFVYQTAAENGALVTFSTYGINVIFLIEFLVSLGFILISIIIYTITDYKINQKLLIWKKNKEEEKKLEMENGTPK
jgi:type III secretory pathway component EscU